MKQHQGFRLDKQYIVTNKLIGRGTYSRVYDGFHLLTKERCAVKVTSKLQLQQDSLHAENFNRELAVNRYLPPHPHLIRAHEVFQTTTHVYQVFEQFEGGKELFTHLLDNGPLEESLARKCFEQLISVVLHLHAHDICHRDIKLENILFNGHTIKLIDLGFARLCPDCSSCLLMTSCGSPNYVAPEVLSKEGYDGKRSDIWSLGVVFYTVLTAKLPFNHENLVTLLNLVRRGIYSPLPKSISQSTRSLVNKMLTIDPSQRISTGQLAAEFNIPMMTTLPPVKWHSFPPSALDQDILQDVVLLMREPERAIEISLTADLPIPQIQMARCIYLKIFINKICRLFSLLCKAKHQKHPFIDAMETSPV